MAKEVNDKENEVKKESSKKTAKKVNFSLKKGLFLGIYIPVDTCGYYLSLHFVLSCQCAKRILPTQTKYTP